jgi:hypothetical protein
MTKRTLKHFALSLALLGVVLSPFPSVAQVGRASKLPAKPVASPRAQAASQQTKTLGSPSYTFTLLNYPGTLSTAAICINKGASTSKTQIVGGYGSAPELNQAGFLARVSGKKTVTESYKSVSYPHEPAQQVADCINDSGQIVGVYVDASDAAHGYELSGGKFTTLDVPFTGAIGTYPFGINNSGEVVGGWADSDGNEHGFTLIGGTYASFDYPDGTETYAADVNSEGDIVGDCYDSSGLLIGFLLSGETYTAIEYSGAVETFASGINDAGDIVGGFCTTSECEVSFDGEQSFLLSGGVFMAIAIPGEVYTAVTDINNSGVVVGYYQDAAGLVGSFLATP